MFSFFSRKPAPSAPPPTQDEAEPTPPPATPPPPAELDHDQQQLHTPSPSVDTDIARVPAAGGPTGSVVNLDDDPDVSMSVAETGGTRDKGRTKAKAKGKARSETGSGTGTTKAAKPRKPRAPKGAGSTTTTKKRAGNAKGASASGSVPGSASVNEDADGAHPQDPNTVEEPGQGPSTAEVGGVEFDSGDKFEQEQQVTDPSGLYSLIASVPPQTLHAYTLTHLRPPPLPVLSAASLGPFTFPAPPGPSSSLSAMGSSSPFNSHNQTHRAHETLQQQELDAQTLTILTRFFRTLEPPPKLHCVRCHRGYFELENNDTACRVPHDDDSALVERVRVALGSSSSAHNKNSRSGYSSSPERSPSSSPRKRVDTRSKRREIESEYETTYGCCGRTVAGDGDMGPPDGWCYEGAHTTDLKRARFRLDWTPQDDKLTSCIEMRCHRERKARDDTSPSRSRSPTRRRRRATTTRGKGKESIGSGSIGSVGEMMMMRAATAAAGRPPVSAAATGASGMEVDEAGGPKKRKRVDSMVPGPIVEVGHERGREPAEPIREEEEEEEEVHVTPAKTKAKGKTKARVGPVESSHRRPVKRAKNIEEEEEEDTMDVDEKEERRPRGRQANKTTKAKKAVRNEEEEEEEEEDEGAETIVVRRAAAAVTVSGPTTSVSALKKHFEQKAVTPRTRKNAKPLAEIVATSVDGEL